jgi:hypothetical protein
MPNKTIILSSLLFLASGNSMAQSFLNSATQAVENAGVQAGEQAVLNAAPAPVQETVNAVNQAQQLNNLSNAGTGLTGAANVPTPSAGGGIVNAVEGQVKQEAAQEAAQKTLNLLQ